MLLLQHWLYRVTCVFSLVQIVYIDGSHEAPDVLTDAVMAWKLLVEGGIMILDGTVRHLHSMASSCQASATSYAGHEDVCWVQIMSGMQSQSSPDNTLPRLQLMHFLTSSVR